MPNLLIPTPDQHLSAGDYVGLVSNLDNKKREAVTLTFLTGGHVPTHMLDFVELTTSFSSKDKQPHEVTFYVLPDYLCLGTDDDWIRIPMSPLTAQRVADAYDCVLPTTKLVSLIWQKASVKHTPLPWGPPFDESMTSTSRFVIHNSRINAASPDPTIGALNAGHKKDVVICNELLQKPTSVAIFGWHQPGGNPIQPLYLGHGNFYADYSHGIRMVARGCLLDGQPADVLRLLKDDNLCVCGSNEGPLKLDRQPGA